MCIEVQIPHPATNHPAASSRKSPSRKLVEATIPRTMPPLNLAATSFDVTHNDRRPRRSNRSFRPSPPGHPFFLDVPPIDAAKRKVGLANCGSIANPLKGLENVTDSEDHPDEPAIPKPSKSHPPLQVAQRGTPALLAAVEAYLAMDWSSLSRDKRIPSNAQVTSRITRTDRSLNTVGASARLLTAEQKEKLAGVELQDLPLTHFMKQLQSKSTAQIISSCHRRFGSCAKDMIEMKHKLFTRSVSVTTCPSLHLYC